MAMAENGRVRLPSRAPAQPTPTHSPTPRARDLLRCDSVRRRDRLERHRSEVHREEPLVRRIWNEALAEDWAPEWPERLERPRRYARMSTFMSDGETNEEHASSRLHSLLNTRRDESNE